MWNNDDEAINNYKKTEINRIVASICLSPMYFYVVVGLNLATN